MTEAIFGLLGVVIGALLQSAGTWFIERRREDWAARKAGRLLAPAFARCQFVFQWANDPDATPTWSAVAEDIEESLSRWPDLSDVLAGTLDQESWNEILGAVGALERILQRARAAAPGEEIDQDDREFLGDFDEVMWGASFTCSMIGTVGTRRRLSRLPRRVWVWLRGKKRLEEEVEEFVAYSYGVHGARPPGASDDEEREEPTKE